MSPEVSEVVESALVEVQNVSEIHHCLTQDQQGLGAVVKMSVRLPKLDVLSDRLRRFLPDNQRRDSALKVISERWHDTSGKTPLGQEILRTNHVASDLAVGGMRDNELVQGIRSDWKRSMRKLFPRPKNGNDQELKRHCEYRRLFTVAHLLRAYRRGLQHVVDSCREGAITADEVPVHERTYESLAIRTTATVAPLNIHGIAELDDAFLQPLDALEISNWLSNVILAAQVFENCEDDDVD